MPQFTLTHLAVVRPGPSPTRLTPPIATESVQQERIDDLATALLVAQEALAVVPILEVQQVLNAGGVHYSADFSTKYTVLRLPGSPETYDLKVASGKR